MYRLARQAFEHRQPLLSTCHLATGVAPVLGVVHGLDGLVGSSLADIVAIAVLAACSRLAYQFGLAVTVEVVDEELCIVCARPGVWSEVYAPQLGGSLRGHVELVCVNVYVARISRLRVVLRVRWVPFHDKLILPVTVHVANRAVVGRVCVLSSVQGTTRRAVKSLAQVDVAPWCHGLCAIHLHVIHLCHNLVTVGLCAVGVGIVGNREVALDGASIPYDVELRLQVVSTEKSPAEENTLAARCRQCHWCAVYLLHLRHWGVEQVVVAALRKVVGRNVSRIVVVEA